MKHLSQSRRIPREGTRQISDPTDPDYLDKRLARMVAEYKSLPKADRDQYLAYLGKRDYNQVMDRLEQGRKK